MGDPGMNIIHPQRIQRKRTKGWRMPADTVYVGRPTKWGNPFEYQNRQKCVDAYRNVLELHKKDSPEWFEKYITPLRGKNLACWCLLDQPCHADVLLELANK
jgi:hypothetical protein